MQTYNNSKKLTNLFVKKEVENGTPIILARARANCAKIRKKGKWVICYQGQALELRTVFTIKKGKLSYVQTAGQVEDENWEVFGWNAELKTGHILKGA